MKKIKCGLLGEHLGHSFSPQIHRELADYSYELFEMPEEEVQPFLASDKFDFINVTIICCISLLIIFFYSTFEGAENDYFHFCVIYFHV